MFGKLQVLESKLDIYEDLSKEMLDKLERAVATISDNSKRVAIILERHENRLDEGEKTNEAIMRLIEKVEEKVDNVEKRVNDISRFRWITIGVATTAVVIIKSADFFSVFFSQNQTSSLTTPQKSAIVRMLG